MTRQYFIGLFAEGNTDYRFLESVVEKVFYDIAYRATGNFEFRVSILNPQTKGTGFTEKVLNVATYGYSQFSINVLCVHRDADSSDRENVWKYSFSPAIEAIEKADEECCDEIIPVIPVHTIESWLFADKQLFISYLSTELTETDLEISGNPESFRNPKQKLQTAIRISQEGKAKKRRNLDIADFYMPLGSEVSLDRLKELESFSRFYSDVERWFIKNRLIQD